MSRATREIRQESLIFRLQDLHLLWLAIQCYSAKLNFCNSLKTSGNLQSAPTTPQRQRTCPLTSLRFRLFPFRSPLLRKSRLISLPLGTMMVHFPRFAPLKRCYTIKRNGFPHSGTPGSKLVYSSPKIFAVHRALLRLSVPRHPPYTLKTLINKFSRLYLNPTNLTQQ